MAKPFHLLPSSELSGAAYFGGVDQRTISRFLAGGVVLPIVLRAMERVAAEPGLTAQTRDVIRAELRRRDPGAAFPPPTAAAVRSQE